MRTVLLVTVIAIVAACDRAEPGTVSRPPEARRADEAAEPAPGKALVGWWRSPRLCLELFDNGDFELSVMDHNRPKVLAMGAATIARAQEGFTIDLAVARIWQFRYLSSCRKHNLSARWTDDSHALGVALKAGATASLRARVIDDAHVELCGVSCVTLARETPELGGRWETDGLELELGSSVRVRVGNGAVVSGTGDVRSLGADRFTVTFTPEDGQPMSEPVLGATISAGRPLVLTARRLAGERLELCAERCEVLERVFER